MLWGENSYVSGTVPRGRLEPTVHAVDNRYCCCFIHSLMSQSRKHFPISRVRCTCHASNWRPSRNIVNDKCTCTHHATSGAADKRLCTFSSHMVLGRSESPDESQTASNNLASLYESIPDPEGFACEYEVGSWQVLFLFYGVLDLARDSF
jgi:hypothetical protein